MCWLKRDRWKAGIALAGMLLFLVLIVWVPVSAAGAYEGTSGLAAPGTGTVQATPTVDATVTALSKKQLTQQVAQQQHTWDNWLWSNTATIVSSFLSTLVLVIGALIGFWQWRVNRKDTKSTESEDRRVAQDKELIDRQDEREKRAEERFLKVVEGLGSERTEAKVGAAITLRTFLQPGYERFYLQAFDLAVAHLRLRKSEASAPEPTSLPAHVLIVPRGNLRQERQPPPPTASIPLDSLSQALITVFKESFPLARKELKTVNAQFDPQQLDATNVRLDHAYLVGADLVQAWLVRASLREADLSKAHLEGAMLVWAHLEGADLHDAHLEGANLTEAHLEGADLTEANPEDTVLLKDTKMYGVIGLTPEQREVCIKKGAIFDDVQQAPAAATSSPSALPPAQSNDVQIPSVLSAQVNTPTPGTDGSSATSPEQGSEW